MPHFTQYFKFCIACLSTIACIKRTIQNEPQVEQVEQVVIEIEEQILTQDVLVEVYPEDAVIHAVNSNGVEVQLSSGINELLLGQWGGTISKKGWIDEPFQVNVTPDTNKLTYQLTPEIQQVTFSADPKSRSRLLDENEDVVHTWTGEATFSLSSGKYTLKTSWSRFPDKEQTLLIDRDRNIYSCPEHAFNRLTCERIIYSRRAPKSVSFSPDGQQIWTALLVGPPAVRSFSVETGDLLKSIDLGEKGGVELLFSDDGQRLWVSQMHTSSVFEIDTSTFEILRQFSSKSTWTKVIATSHDEDFLYVSNWVGDDVSEIDLQTGTVSRKWKTNDTPRGLFYTGDNKLFVASFEEGTVQSIDLDTEKITTIFSGALSARHLEFDENLGRLYISDIRGGKIWLLDVNTGKTEVLARVERNPNTIKLSPDKRLLFVSCRGRNNPESYIKPGPEYGAVFVLDAHTGTVLDVIVGGNQPTGLDVSADGKWLAFSNFLDHQIRIYSIPPTEELLNNADNEAILEYKKYLRK